MVVGFLMGGGFMVFESVTGQGIPKVLVTQHAHILLVGFFTNMVMGVAYWMFPRPKGFRYSERLAAATYFLLNGGLVLRVIAEPAYVFYSHPIWASLMALAGLSQVAGGLGFVYNAWRRVASPKIVDLPTGRERWRSE